MTGNHIQVIIKSDDIYQSTLTRVYLRVATAFYVAALLISFEVKKKKKKKTHRVHRTRHTSWMCHSLYGSHTGVIC